MAISNYENGFPNGVAIRGIPLIDLQNSAGRVFWVDSSNPIAGDANKGTFLRPLRTLKAAIPKCRSNQSDKIFIAAGHTETMDGTNNVNINIAGIQIIGLGNKENRPYFHFTSNLAKFEINEENVYVGNIRFQSNVTGGSPLETILRVRRKYAYMEHCYFENVSETHGSLTFLEVVPIGEHHTTNGATVAFCEFHTHDTGITTPVMNSAILAGGAINNLHIHFCTINGKFGMACINSFYTWPDPTSQRLLIDGSNYFLNALMGEAYKVIIFNGARSGFISKETIAVTYNAVGEDIELGGRAGRGINGDVEYLVFDLAYSDLVPEGYQLTKGTNGAYKIEGLTYDTSGTVISDTGGIVILEKAGETKPRGNPLISSIPILNIFTPNATIQMTHPSAIATNFSTITSGGQLFLRITPVNIVGGGRMRVTIRLRKVVDATYYISRNFV